MPEFYLDTSGAVAAPINHHGSTGPLQWSDLSDFAQGYIEALFFTWPDDEGDFIGGITSPAFGDLASETLRTIVADCETFERENAATLESAYARDYDASQAGRDFWFTRCGHGVGFWDREALEPDSAEYERLTTAMVDARRSNSDWDALLSQRNRLKAESIRERLSAAARKAGNRDAYMGDDGKVYLS